MCVLFRGSSYYAFTNASSPLVSIRYDLSGIPPHQLEQWVAGDWEFMINQKHVLESPSYIREHGVPVVALWVSPSSVPTFLYILNSSLV